MDSTGGKGVRESGEECCGTSFSLPASGVTRQSSIQATQFNAATNELTHHSTRTAHQHPHIPLTHSLPLTVDADVTVRGEG